MKFYIVIFSLCFSCTSFGQISKRELKRTERSARAAFEEQDYFSALLYYKKLDSLVPKEGLINATIAVCYQELNHFEDALIALDKAISYGYTHYDQYLIRGKIYHSHHHFDKALLNYYLYKGLLDKESTKYQQELDEVENLIRQCDNGYLLKANALVIEISNLGEDINTEFPEYAPVISSDEEILLFTSRRPNTTGGKKEHFSGKYFEDIYISIKENGDWSNPQNIKQINTTHHDACVGLSANGKALLLYRPDTKNFNGGNLFISFLKDSTNLYSWSSPKSLGDNINSKYWEPSGCISSDYKVIYFVSNRPGGFGGTDVYKSIREDDETWGEAVNLGPNVNTKYDEDSPYITPGGNVLYFSSKGHQGMGGYDIFMVLDPSEKGEWMEPINLGYPINSAKDDLHFSWNLAGTQGYFSSVREDSYGEHDLYHITRPESSTHKVYLKGIVTDYLTGGSVKNARISLINKSGNKVITEVFTDKNGNYKIPIKMGEDYQIIIESNGYVSKDDDFCAPEEGYYYEIAKNLDIKPYSEKVVIESAKSINREEYFLENEIEEMIVLGKGDHFAMRKVHFIFNKPILEDDSYDALNELVKYLKAHNKVHLEVSGHTDDIGTHEFNQYLSQSRANTVVRYLVSKGIPKSRLIANGYGEENPLVSNANNKGRRLNRRAEFKVLGTKSANSKNEIATIQKENNIDFLKWKVHFPFNEWEKITQYSQSKLFKVIQYMVHNPSERVKIHAHADPIGSYEYNRALSERRALTVQNFLIKNGVSEERLVVKSFGENYPLIQTESIQFNVKNRRIEFEVIR